MEQQAELVGPEGMAAQAVGEAALLEILDAELGMIASLGIPGVERLGRVIPRGHDKAEIQALLQRFRLINHTPLMVPGARLILPVGDQPDFLPGFRPLLSGLLGEWCCQGLEPLIAHQGNGVGDALCLQVVVEGRHRKAGVAPDFDGNLGPATTEE